MIHQFRPYMTTNKINEFRTDLAEIAAAKDETHVLVDRRAAQYPAAAQFDEQYPAIDADMTSMLATMQRNIGHYRGVAALPPFWLFPWFFVAPGLMVAGVALWALRRERTAGGARTPLRLLAVLGLAIVAAPAVFQMFTRAPGGAHMIDDFKPIMTPRKVGTVQGYFLVIGAGEGQLRNEVVPQARQAATAAHQPPPAVANLTRFSRDWPGISAAMAPMIGTMADNIGNFHAVTSLPPFWLFPWFFVIPGLLIALLAWGAMSSRGAATSGVGGGTLRAAPGQSPDVERTPA
jgi:hypothetical protein